jgi:uncharacterized protein with PIN domain
MREPKFKTWNATPTMVGVHCDKCDSELKFVKTLSIMDSPLDPNRHMHRCEVCKKLFYLDDKYPKVTFKRGHIRKEDG